ERPYRAAWMSRGLQIDGWTSPRRRSTLRFFASSGAPEPVHVILTLAAPPDAPATYSLNAHGTVRRGRLAASATSNPTVDLCIPAGSYTDVGLEGTSPARLPAAPLTFAPTPERRVGVAVLGVDVRPGGGTCAP